MSHERGLMGGQDYRRFIGRSSFRVQELIHSFILERISTKKSSCTAVRMVSDQVNPLLPDDGRLKKVVRLTFTFSGLVSLSHEHGHGCYQRQMVHHACWAGFSVTVPWL